MRRGRQRRIGIVAIPVGALGKGKLDVVHEIQHVGRSLNQIDLFAISMLVSQFPIHGMALGSQHMVNVFQPKQLERRDEAEQLISPFGLGPSDKMRLRSNISPVYQKKKKSNINGLGEIDKRQLYTHQEKNPEDFDNASFQACESGP